MEDFGYSIEKTLFNMLQAKNATAISFDGAIVSVRLWKMLISRFHCFIDVYINTFLLVFISRCQVALKEEPNGLLTN